MRKNYKKQEVQQLKRLDEYLIIYKNKIILRDYRCTNN